MNSIIKGIENIIPIIKCKKFLLIAGKSFDNLEIKREFDKLNHIEYRNFSPNPLYEQVCEAVEIFNKENCEMIVAVGGGSAIDVAKCVKLFCKMDKTVNYLHQEYFDTHIELIAIPTTAGTGSESTRHAVIYYEGEKQSISHISIVPDYAVLDASLLNSLPIYQKKCTLFDALCQAIESWWSVNSTDESIDYSKKAISMIVANWRDYIENNDSVAAEYILEAANYSGKAINITATTAAHAMSYKITSLYNIPHGHAVAICMLYVWKYLINNTDKCIDNRGAEYLKRILLQIDTVINYEIFCDIYSKMDMKSPISDDKEKDIRLLVKSVNPDRLKNYPVQLSEDAIREIYEKVIE